jgi:hypothetical protein
MFVPVIEHPADKRYVMEVILRHNRNQYSMDVIVSFILRPLLSVVQRAIFFLYEGVGLRPLACCDWRFESRQEAWMLFCCECCVLSGRVLCEELITHPEKSYRLWCVVVCDLETTRLRMTWPALGPALHVGGDWKSLIFFKFSLDESSSL